GILPVLVENRTGYKNLCELLTQAHLRNEKGTCAVRWDELPEFADGLMLLLGSARLQRADASPPRTFGILPKRTSTGFQGSKSSRMQNAFASTLQACAPQNSADRAKLLIDIFGRQNVFVELQRHFIRGEERINRELIDLGRANRLPLIATNGVQYAKRYG